MAKTPKNTQQEYSDALDLLNAMKIGDYTNEQRLAQAKVVASKFNSHSRATAPQGMNPKRQKAQYFYNKYLQSPC